MSIPIPTKVPIYLPQNIWKHLQTCELGVHVALELLSFQVWSLSVSALTAVLPPLLMNPRTNLFSIHVSSTGLFPSYPAYLVLPMVSLRRGDFRREIMYEAKHMFDSQALESRQMQQANANLKHI